MMSLTSYNDISTPCSSKGCKNVERDENEVRREPGRCSSLPAVLCTVADRVFLSSRGAVMLRLVMLFALLLLILERV